MKREILLESIAGEIRLAVMEDGELAEYCAEGNRCQIAGNIYAGHVENVLPGMDAAFVNIGLERNAFLHSGDIGVDGGEELKGRVGNSLPRPGQEILVQVIKEPVGKKGARVSCHVTLPGRLLVLLPTVSYAGVSRKIKAEGERARLRAIADELCRETGVGMIVRTSAEGADAEELAREYAELVRQWNAIQARGNRTKAPALVHRDDSLVSRAVRDFLGCCAEGIYTDSPELYQEVRAAAEMLAPEHVHKVKLRTEFENLFDAYGVDRQLQRDLRRQVWLKSGAYLVFDMTEALTVIDVNTGKFVGRDNFSETVFQANCEAAKEIARQLRLRDIGGIVVIDFIDMDSAEKRDRLVALFNEYLRQDRTHTGVAGLTRLGLVEMTRKKIRQSVVTRLTRTCPACRGTGVVLSGESAARMALREAIRLNERTGQKAVVHAARAVAEKIVEIGAPKGTEVYVAIDSCLHEEEYRVTGSLTEPCCAKKISS